MLWAGPIVASTAVAMVWRGSRYQSSRNDVMAPGRKIAGSMTTDELAISRLVLFVLPAFEDSV